MARPNIAATARDFDAIRARRSRPQILVEGDSIPAALFQMNSQSALFWSCFEALQYSYNPDYDNFAVGGSLSDTTGITTGMLHPARLTRCVDRCNLLKSAGLTPAVPIVWIVSIGMNGNSTTLLGDIKKWWAIVGALSDQLIILSTQPSTGGWMVTEDQAKQRIENNNKIARWAAENAHEIQFVDITQYCLKNTPNSASDMFPPLGDANDTVGSGTRDGSHPCGFGAYLMAKALMPALARVCPPVHSRIASPYNGIFGGGGNILGAAGRFNRGGGSSSQIASVTTSDGGSITGIANFPADAGGFGGNLAGIQVALSLVPYEPIRRATGRTDVLALKLAFSGTTTAASSLQFGKDVTVSRDASYPVEVEADMFFEGMQNFRQMAISGVSGSDGIRLGQASPNSQNSDTIVLPVNGRFQPRSSWGYISSSAQFSGLIGWSWPAGVVVDGAVHILGYGGFVCPPIPPETA